MDKALISVIIPVYNVSEYIDRCVESLLSQTYSNIEIILINDGSNDNSSEVCHRLSDLHEDKIRVIDQENKGVSAARNAGLDIATGEYIAFVDADDWVSEDYLEKLYTAIIENDADLASCGFTKWHNEDKQKKYIYPNPGTYNKYEFYQEMHLNQVLLWVTMYRKSIIEEKNLRFDTQLRRMEDGCFVAEYCTYCDKFVTIPEHLYYYYQREGSAINQYHHSTILGVERTAYIIEKLEAAYKRSEIGFKLCEQEFVSKWARFISRIAVGITRKDSKFSNKEKREFLRESIRVSRIKERLCALDLSKCTRIDKTLAKWTQKERITLLLAYGR